MGSPPALKLSGLRDFPELGVWMPFTHAAIRPPQAPAADHVRAGAFSTHLLIFVVSTAGLLAGLLAKILGAHGTANGAWFLTTFLGIVPLSYGIVRDLRQGRTGVDVIALLAMVSALIVDEYLAAAVVAVMLATGRSLEEYASGRAQRELTALLARAPRTANRYRDGELESVDLDEVHPGDRLLVRSGEVVPADGAVAGDLAVLDESALTGESVPVERLRGDTVRSGVVNAAGPFDMVVSVPASESTYAGIIRMVEEAEKSRAPFVRLADRYAFFFLPLTLLIAGASWLFSGDPVRVVAVFVVATPCPLILAAPVAIVAGVSRAAGRGIIVKGGAALEALTRGRVLLFDKTGTLTAGRPVVSEVEAHGRLDESEVLRLAASLDQASPHILAGAIVTAARNRGLVMRFPEAVQEVAGAGIKGRVEGCEVRVGTLAWADPGRGHQDWVTRLRRRASMEGATVTYVAVEGELCGAVVMEDRVRPDSARTLRALRSSGIKRMVMVTGDRAEVAEIVAMAVGVDRVLAERSPQEKVEAVRQEAAYGSTIMVGDGINDAPALAAADVGVAMGARGATASSEAADVVLVVDRLDRLAEAINIAKRSRRIALESVILGMGLSLVAMGFAGFGYLTPVAGALLQEGIDVLSIANALRALTGYAPRRQGDGVREDLSHRFGDKHQQLVPKVNQLRTLADRLDSLDGRTTRAELVEAHEFLSRDLIPHEREEEEQLYPLMARYLGGEDPLGPLVRTHAEIARQTRVLGQLIDEMGEDGPEPQDLPDFRRILYGLNAVLLLHLAQEEEAYMSGDANAG